MSGFGGGGGFGGWSAPGPSRGGPDSPSRSSPGISTPGPREGTGTRNADVKVGGGSFRSAPGTSMPSPREGGEPVNTAVKIGGGAFGNSSDMSARTEKYQSPAEGIVKEAVKQEFGYAKLRLVLGWLTIIIGVILIAHGVAGSTTWTAKGFGFESNLYEAPPGIILMVVGLYLALTAKPKVELGRLTDK